MRGPAPTPTAILRARGSWRANLRADEPTLSRKTPKCPAFLKGEARREYHRACRLLAEAGCLAETDRATITGYAVNWAEWVAFARICERLVPTITEATAHYPVVFALRNKAFDMMSRDAARLGFSPADRTRLRPLPEARVPSGADRFFNDDA